MTNTINLELTEDQAKLLSLVLASVGGDPYNSGRSVTNEICEKLWEVGMGYTSETEADYPMDTGRQSLWFSDY